MTIEELIAALRAMAEQSPLGIETVVAVCDAEVPYRTVQRTTLDVDSDGAVALLFAQVMR